jgi:hypothetical protein
MRSCDGRKTSPSYTGSSPGGMMRVMVFLDKLAEEVGPTPYKKRVGSTSSGLSITRHSASYCVGISGTGCNWLATLPTPHALESRHDIFSLLVTAVIL